MTAYTRRRLLALGGAITAGAVAGCSGPENAAETAAEGESATGSVLETISLENLDDDARTVDVIAQWGDDIEYWETHDLGAIGESDSSLTLDGEWPTDPGEFQLTVRLSDDDTRAGVSSADLPDHDCLELVVLISREGELSILTDVSGGECSTDSDGDNSSDT
ncbi:hypothetical protein [Halohasta litorea]|uniref:Uncharacterized protein n=1 Tax=Halohasta litorea TaxID=869891 RepID=A0ABD6D864_9EURY|nr:hypothetical protein [Halohasta litorea]MEA1930503.1 hypothetical protein [Euryarchaeota archaeon]